MQEAELRELVIRISRECVNRETGLVNFDALNRVIPAGTDLGTLETIMEALLEAGYLLQEDTEVTVSEPREENSSSVDLSNALAAYVFEIASLTPMNADEEEHLLANLDQFGSKGKERLVRQYLSLVLDLARMRGGRRELILERIQEGNLALVKAAESYRADGRQSFRDFARWAISKAMVRVERAQERSVDLPQKLMQFFKNFRDVGERLSARGGRRPTIEEIAAEMQMSAEEVRNSLALAGSVAHSESALDEDDAAFVRHVRDVTGNRGLNPGRLAALKTVLRENMDKVTPIEQEILTLYYDLNETGEELDFVEIAEALGIKTRLVADFETAAMTKIMNGPAN